MLSSTRAAAENLTVVRFSTLVRSFAAAVVAIAFLASMGSTGHASVVVDDFGTSADDSLVEQGLVNRKLSGGSAIIPGGVSFSPTGLSMLKYEVDDSGMTFGDLDSNFSNGVSFSDSSATAGSDFEIAVYVDGIFSGLQSLVNGGLNFNVDLSNASEVMFLTLGCGCPDHAGSVGGTFSAVPEPTSLILVGVACIGFFSQRRRRVDDLEA